MNSFFRNFILSQKNLARFCVIFLLISGVFPLFAAINTDRATNQSKNSGSGLIISKNGEQLSNGFFGLAQMRPAIRPATDSYMPNVVIVKTKAQTRIAKDSKGFLSSTLQISLSTLNVEKIRAPYSEFSGEGMLATQDKFGVGRIYEVYYRTDIDPVDACADLLNNPDVEYAEPMFKRFTNYTPSDPQFGSQYSLALIKAQQAWDYSKGDAKILIAITDSGTDWEHEDLAANIWTNPKEIAGNGVDDDKNGYVDDFHGWDFVGNITSAEAKAGSWKEDNDPKNRGNLTGPTDGRHHGTHTAGCAAAVTDNSLGIAGVGFNCKILPIKIGSDQIESSVYRGYDAIMYAGKMGAQIINCSWGGAGFMQSEQDVINQVTAMGSLVVASAGNDAKMTDLGGTYPARYKNILSVGATDQNDGIATDFSNYGMATTVYAPGVTILSTQNGNQYASANWSGTSFSCPIVSGICGLVEALHPTWTPMQVLHQIRSTSDNVIKQVKTTPSLRPFFYGRADAYLAVLLNQKFNVSESVPGVGTTQIGISSSNGYLSDYSPTTLRLKVQNYLAPANNLQITLQSLDGYLQITQPTKTIASLGTMLQDSVDATVQISPNCPWYAGSVSVLVTYTSGSYVDYERIEIPVSLQSNNSYHLIFDGLPNDFNWQGASTAGMNYLWAVGVSKSTGYGVYGIASTSQVLNYNYLSLPSYCIYGFDANKAFAGINAQNGGNAAVNKTTDGGQNWTPTSVNSITGFINDIHFFDANNGIILGDPLNGRWGVAKTTDGGANWTLVQPEPSSPLTGESGLVGAVCWQGNYGWFGTSKGRVIYTTNKGQTWSVANIGNLPPNRIVVNVAFATKDKGIAIYRDSSLAKITYGVASSINGGQSWSDKQYDLATIGVTPVFSFAPDSSAQAYTLGAASQIFGTKTNGTQWSPILSERTISSAVGAGITNKQIVRIWNVGGTLGYLDFPYLSVSNQKKITANTSIDFGTVTAPNSASRIVIVRNRGWDTVNFSTPASISPVIALPDEFSITNSLPTSLEPGAQFSLTLSFTPMQDGARSATLTIPSDAPVVTTALTGTGVGVSSVNDGTIGEFNLLQNEPNPFGESTAIRFSLPISEQIFVKIFDLVGNEVATLADGWFEAGNHILELKQSTQFSNISTGTYFYRLQTAQGTLLRTMLILR